MVALFFAIGMSNAHAAVSDYVLGGFEMNGYISLVTGWQHFSNDAVTEVAQDGSFAGPLGEMIPDVLNGTIPSPGQDNFEFAIQVVELDIEKHFGDRAKVKADLQFGRAQSGSPIANISLEHAYAQVTLWKKYNLQLTVGRFGLQAGLEPYQTYFNDTISWSILWRGLIALGVNTGVQLSADINDHLSLYLSGSNGFVRDVRPGFAKIPSFIASAVVSWGRRDRESNFVFSAFGAPEMGNNHDFLVGYDAFITWWFAPRWELGLESTFQHHQSTTTGPATDYIAGLFNLHWDFMDSAYAVLKYAYAWQSNAGNAVLNLTGAKQHIHEISLGGAYFVADNAKWKFEWRTDIVDPAVGNTQFVYGFITGLAYAF